MSLAVRKAAQRQGRVVNNRLVDGKKGMKVEGDVQVYDLLFQ